MRELDATVEQILSKIAITAKPGDGELCAQLVSINWYVVTGSGRSSLPVAVQSTH
jgi:hypothetical protein